MNLKLKWIALLFLLAVCVGPSRLLAQEAAFLSESFGDSAWLGVRINDITKTKMSDLKLQDPNGVLIEQVEKDSPAEKAGLLSHDVIIQLNGVKVLTVRQFTRMIRELLPERTVLLVILRDGAQKNITATLGERPRPDFASRGPRDLDSGLFIDLPRLKLNLEDMQEKLRDGMRHMTIFESSRGRLGVTLQSLSTQLGDYFGVKDGHGALVVSVRKDGPADKAGVKAGDVIVGIDAREVKSPSDLIFALREKPEGSHELRVIRERQSKSFSVKLEKSVEESGFQRRPAKIVRRRLAFTSRA